MKEGGGEERGDKLMAILIHAAFPILLTLAPLVSCYPAPTLEVSQCSRAGTRDITEAQGGPPLCGGGSGTAPLL